METLNMEERLWDFIDGLSNESENASIQMLLQHEPEWKLKYDELLSVHQLINSSTLDEPSMRFAQNVMEEISKFQIAPATKTYINKKIIYGLGGFFITMIAGLLIYLMSQLNWSRSDSDTRMPVDLSKIQWNGILNNPYTMIFMMINLVLGLMLLDRYLNRKKLIDKENQA